MKFEVYGTPTRSENIIKFESRIDKEGDFVVKAVDNDGNTISIILWIDAEYGELHLAKGVEAKIGLPLDDSEKISVADD